MKVVFEMSLEGQPGLRWQERGLSVRTRVLDESRRMRMYNFSEAIPTSCRLSREGCRQSRDQVPQGIHFGSFLTIFSWCWVSTVPIPLTKSTPIGSVLSVKANTGITHCVPSGGFVFSQLPHCSSCQRGKVPLKCQFLKITFPQLPAIKPPRLK